MKEKKLSDIQKLFRHCTNWAKLEIEYVKLTAAEKLTIFLTAIMLCAVFLLIGMVLLVVLAQCVVDVFRLFMATWLACLLVGGILVLLMVLIYIFRRPLIVNPIAKFITKLIIDKE